MRILARGRVQIEASLEKRYQCEDASWQLGLDEHSNASCSVLPYVKAQMCTQSPSTCHGKAREGRNEERSNAEMMVKEEQGS
jgi:hypothetical protein